VRATTRDWLASITAAPVPPESSPIPASGIPVRRMLSFIEIRSANSSRIRSAISSPVTGGRPVLATH
jgi:hypothetical protein